MTNIRYDCDNLGDKQDDNYGDDNGCGDKCCSQLAISTVCLSSFPPISPSPVFGHLLVIIKILNVAMIKAFSRKDANSQLLLRGDEK